MDQKGAYLRKEITDSVSSGLEPPRLMLEAIYRFRNETRAIDAILLPASAVGPIAAPSDEEVKKYFAERESTFRAKEFRKLTVLAATPAALAKPAEVAADEVRKYYDEVKAQRFGAPEKREVSQLVFKTEIEAKDALARLKGGATFDALAAERKLDPKDANLGLVTQGDFGDAKVGAAVFSLPAPGFTEIVATPFGFVVSRVAKIQPAVFSKTFRAGGGRAARGTRHAQGRSDRARSARRDRGSARRRQDAQGGRRGGGAGGARHRSG